MELIPSLSAENAGQLHMNDMPEEVIIHIFSFLKLKDRKNTRLVCKRWNRLSYSFGLIRKDVTHLDNNFELMRNPSPYSQLTNIYFHLDEWSHNSLTIISNSTSFWLTHCKNLRTVNVDIIGDVYWVMLGIFLSCPAIEHITITAGCAKAGCDLADFSSVKVHFPNLQSLQVSGYDPEVFPLLNSLLRNAPKLHTVFVDFSVSIYKFFDSRTCWGDITSEFYGSITNVLGPQLERLTVKFHQDTELAFPPLNSIASRCVNLKYLALESIDMGLLKQLGSLDSLTSLSLGGYSLSVTDDALTFLTDLPNLSHLDIGFTIHLTRKAIYEAFCKRVRPKMTELRLRILYCLPRYDLIKVIAPYLPNLRVLHVESVNITIQSFEALMMHNRSLQCLTLKGRYREIPEYGFLTSYAMNNLIHLDVHAINIPKQFIDKLEMPSLKVLIWTYGRYKAIRQIEIWKESLTLPRQWIGSARWRNKLTCCKSPLLECFVQGSI